MKRIDLHTHSRYSDGTLSPAEVVARAAKAGVDLLVLTDHDSISGWAEAADEGRAKGVEVLCGVEINTRLGDRVHLLGYSRRWEEPLLSRRLAELRERRARRAERIVESLRERGVPVTIEEVRGVSRESLGRPHVADALVRKGVVRSRQEAFDRFLAKGKPGYVESMGPTAEEAIDLIREAGGFSSLAHPQTVGDLSELPGWVARGLEGIEVHYASHGPSDTRRFAELARGHGLLSTGGSDYHGPGSGRDGALGVEVPDEVYERFQERLAR